MHLVSGPALTRWAVPPVALGLVGGIVWRLLAHPGAVTMTSAGPVTTEAETAHQFANVMLFLGVGAVICVPWAFALAFAGPHPTWRLVPLVVVLSLASGAIARAIGLAFTPDEPAVPKGTKVGETIPGVLTMDAWAAVVAWAAFGVAGLLVATWIRAPEGQGGARP